MSKETPPFRSKPPHNLSNHSFIYILSRLSSKKKQDPGVWCSEDLVLNGLSISSIFALNRVSLHDYSLIYRNLTASRNFTGLPMYSILTGRRHDGDRRFIKWTRFLVKASWLNIRRECCKACGTGTQERYCLI